MIVTEHTLSYVLDGVVVGKILDSVWHSLMASYLLTEASVLEWIILVSRRIDRLPQAKDLRLSAS